MSAVPVPPAQNYFKIYAGSTELSPFHWCYATEDTVLRTCAGRFFVHDNGDDMVAAYWALRKKAVLYDVPERPVEISGPEALAFLEKIFARQISSPVIGRGYYTLACTHSGGLFMDGILFRLDETRFWFVQPDGDMHTWLLAHNTGFDVTISDPKSRVLQLQGPASFTIMNAASGGAIDREMGYFHAGFFDIGGQEVYVSRTGWTGELGYEIYTQGAATDGPQLWQHLMKSGHDHGMIFGAMHSMNIRRIEAGILDSGSDFDTSMTPFEAGLERFIDLKKDQFIGKEALLSAKRGKRLYGLTCKDLTPRRGDAIFAENVQVGVVTTGAQSPFLAVGIGYVRFYEAGPWPGKKLLLYASGGGQAECDILEPPFYNRDKQTPRVFQSKG